MKNATCLRLITLMVLLAAGLAGCAAVEYSEPCVCAAEDEATFPLPEPVGR